MTATNSIPSTVKDVLAKINEIVPERPTTEDWREIWRPLLFNAKLGAVGEEQVVEHLVALNVGGKRALNAEMKEFRAEQQEKMAKAGGVDGPRPDKYVTLVNILRTNRTVLPTLPRFNLMSQSVELSTRELKEVDVSKLRERLGKLGTGCSFGKDDIFDALVQVANEQAYHPVQEYLNGLVWDGVPRLNRMAEDYFGNIDPLAAVMMRKFAISAVARGLTPGCKVDTALILVGAQGVCKSSFFKVMAGPWFSDTSIDLGNKDSYALLSKAWLFEWAELEAMQRARSQNTVKSFLSSTEDTYRPPYGRVTVTVKRSGVIVGTTNEYQFLTDPTGNRRYWPLEVLKESIDLAKLAVERDQLWAEAVAAFKSGEQWWLTTEQQAMLEKSQQEYEVGSVWEESVRAYVDGKVARFDGEVPGPLDWVTTSDLLAMAIGKPVAQQKRSDHMEVAKVMLRLKWESGQRMVNGERLRGYARPAARV